MLTTKEKDLIETISAYGTALRGSADRINELLEELKELLEGGE